MKFGLSLKLLCSAMAIAVQTVGVATEKPRKEDTTAIPNAVASMQAQRDLRLFVKQAQPYVNGQSEAGEPWVTIVIKNAGKRTWYFSRLGVDAGMKIAVHKPDGKRAALTKEGQELAVYRDTSRPTHNADLGPGESEEFIVGLGQYAQFPGNTRVLVDIEWTIHMHSSKSDRLSVAETPVGNPGFRVVLKRTDVQLLAHRKN